MVIKYISVYKNSIALVLKDLFIYGIIIVTLFIGKSQT